MVVATASSDIYRRHAAVEALGTVAAQFPEHPKSRAAANALSGIATRSNEFSGVRAAAVTALAAAGPYLTLGTAVSVIGDAKATDECRLVGVEVTAAGVKLWTHSTVKSLLAVAFDKQAPHPARLAVLQSLYQPNAELEFDAEAIGRLVRPDQELRYFGTGMNARRLYNEYDARARAGVNVVVGVIAYAAQHPTHHRVLAGIVQAFCEATGENEIGVLFPPRALSIAVGLAGEKHPKAREAFERALADVPHSTPRQRALLAEFGGQQLRFERVVGSDG